MTIPLSREHLYRIEKATAQAALILDGWVAGASQGETYTGPSEDTDFPENY